MIELYMENSWTKVIYPENSGSLEKIVDKALHEGLGVKEDHQSLMNNFAYRHGHYDGIIKVYDDKNQRFPTGLIRQVEHILGETQAIHNFQFKVTDDRPDPLLTPEDVPETISFEDTNSGEMITLRDYQMEAIENVVEERDGVLHLSTGSGKSFTAAGLIKLAIDHIQSGEKIGFFVHKKDLFKQSYDVLSSALDMHIGRIGSGKFDEQLVNVIMVPTAASALRIDVEKGLRFTPKQMVIKKMATTIAPEFISGVNQRMLLRNYVMNMNVKTKADEAFKAEINKLIKESESDAKCIFNLNAYTVQYNKLLEEKNADKYKKKKKMEDFLSTIVMGVFDEAHSVHADGYYKVALACDNALMKVGLTGSIDRKNELLTQRITGVFHNVVSTTRNHEMIDRGVLADVEVMLVPITTVMYKGKQINTDGFDWRDAYEYGIVENEYRNALAAKIAEQWYERGETVLIVVGRIKHGENISGLLDSLGIEHAYIHGESEQDYRDKIISDVREGRLKVLLSSTIIDEGIDIPNLSVLVNVAGMKSLRVTLQRSGRILRRKEDGGKARVIDFEDNTNKYLRKHSLERNKIYKDEKFPIKRLD